MDNIEAQLVADIYRTAVAPEQWINVLDRLCVPLGAQGSALLALDLTGLYNYKVSQGNSLYTPQIMREYEEKYSAHEEEHFRRVSQSPPHTVQYDPEISLFKSGEVLRPDVDFLNTNFSVLDRIAIRLSADESWFDCLTFQYNNQRSNATPEELGLLNQYLPHMSEALVLARSFAQIKQKFGAVFKMLDRISNGLVLVTERSQVVLANRAANDIFDTGKGIALSKNGEINIDDLETSRLLKKAIYEASRTAKACGDSANTLLPVRRKDNGDPYLVEVSPLVDHYDEMGCTFAGAIVTIIDPHCERTYDLAGMCKVYNLSSAEASIASLIIDGLSNRDIAQHRGVSVETVKSQTKSIYQKTNSRNRAELIRRALRIALPIDLN